MIGVFVTGREMSVIHCLQLSERDLTFDIPVLFWWPKKYQEVKKILDFYFFLENDGSLKELFTDRFVTDVNFSWNFLQL